MPTYIIHYKKSAKGQEYRIEQKADTLANARYNFRQKHLHWFITRAYEKTRSIK